MFIEIMQNLKNVYCWYSLCRTQWSHQNPFSSHLHTVQTNAASEAKDLVPTAKGTTPDSESSYCAVTLQWLRQLDAETKEAILLEGAVLKNGMDEDRNVCCSAID
jgi:hypothetical protein